MKLLAMGPVHRERLTVPYCWVLRYDEGKYHPYVVHRRLQDENKDGVVVSFSYSNGFYFDDQDKALVKWLEKVKVDLERNLGGKVA